MSFSGHNLDRVRSFSYVEDDFLFVTVAASVNGNEEVMASAFNAKRDFRIVA